MYTVLSASFTNNYLAPCSLTPLVVHSPALSFAPFTPHWLSEIQPVKELSAAIANAPAKSVAAIATANRTFMSSPSRNPLRFLIRRAAQQLGTKAGPVSRLFLGPLTANSYSRMSTNKKGGFSGILPIFLCSQGVENQLLRNSLIPRTPRCSPRVLLRPSDRSGSPWLSSW